MNGEVRVLAYGVVGMGFENSCWLIAFASGRSVSISGILLHPCVSPATPVSIPARFPRNPRGFRHPHCAASPLRERQTPPKQAIYCTFNFKSTYSYRFLLFLISV